MNMDNPAARLLKILELGQEKERHAVSLDVWYELLQLDTDSSSLLLSRLGKLMELPDLIIREITNNFPPSKKHT